MAALTRSLGDTLTLTESPATVSTFALSLAATLTLTESLQIQNPSFLPLAPLSASITPLVPLSTIVLPPLGD